MVTYSSFNPLNDRLARDIRNDLARTFVKCLVDAIELAPVNKLAAQLLAGKPGQIYENYINDRLARYLAAKAAIIGQKIKDPFYQALVLWDHELFFETHEVLEAIWIESAGSPKLILQAMIRAAGFYIHLGTGNQTGAEKMAARAWMVLVEHRGEVPPFPGLDNLVKCLEQRNAVPPKLL